LAAELRLEVRGLVAGYGNNLVLRGVDFDVAAGEVVTLLGANGSGKSTALNTISGFVRAASGSILLDGTDITSLPPHRSFRCGVVQVSQRRDLFGDLSVDDNLRLGAAVRGDEERGLAQVLELFPKLAERRHQPVSTMSGGEQQMVAIGRALMNEPRILLLDEPSGGLAPALVKEISEITLRLKEAGRTMLVVEQNLRLALEVCDRFIILRDGQVIEGGRASDLEGSYDDIVRTIYL
jgi:branched-chain amino acid transport system ATP-binding protein